MIYRFALAQVNVHVSYILAIVNKVLRDCHSWLARQYKIIQEGIVNLHNTLYQREDFLLFFTLVYLLYMIPIPSKCVQSLNLFINIINSKYPKLETNYCFDRIRCVDTTSDYHQEFLCSLSDLPCKNKRLDVENNI